MSEVNPSSSSPDFPRKTANKQFRVVINNPPESFSKKLALGERFKVTLYTTAKKGHYDTQTHLGRIRLQTSLPLPNNSILELQLVSKGNQLQALITTINGLAPLKALRTQSKSPIVSKEFNLKTNYSNKANSPLKKSTTSLTKNIQKKSSTNISFSSASSNGQKSLIGKNLIATLLKSNSKFTNKRNSVDNLSGTKAKLVLEGSSQIIGKKLRSSLTSSAKKDFLRQPKNISNKGSGNTEALRQNKNHRITRTEQKSLSEITQITIQIKSLQFSPSTRVYDPIQFGSYLATGSILNGTVTDKYLPSGQQVIQTQIGLLVISTNSSLPIGSQLTLEIIDLTSHVINTTKEALTNQIGLFQPLIQKWPSLEDAIHTLNQSNPAAAQQLVQAIIPHPGPTLGGNIIFFIMALSSGNLSNWFGDLPMRALQLSKPELLARLKRDFSEIDQLSKKSNLKEWRSTMLPFNDGSQINPLRLSINSNSDRKNKEGQSIEGGTNFIIDLDLRVTGRFQMDGFVYRDRNRLDLIVRTKNKLPLRTQDGIRRIFQESTDTIGLMGGVVFQSSPANFVETLDSIKNDELVGSLV
jgi:hypothetical protein